MRAFLHSTMDWDLGGEEIANHPCEIRVGDAEIVISYVHHGDRHLWRGTSVDGATFDLSHVGHPGDSAALKRTDEFTLEGEWRERNDGGSWRIDLNDEA